MLDLGRVVTFVIPTVAVGVTALVLVGPGALRPAIGVRVYGAPADGARTVALRLLAVRSYYGTEDSVELRDLALQSSAPGVTPRAWTGETGSDGVAEILLEAAAPLHSALALQVSQGGDLRRPRILAEGQIALRSPPPLFAQLGALPGTARGELAIHVDAARGVFTSPFPETIDITVAPAPPALRLAVKGAGIDAVASEGASPPGVFRYSVKALAHDVELSIDATAGAQSGHWEGTLPVVPGGLWLEPGTARNVISPVPRERAYVSLWGPGGRAGGAVVLLARDGLGFFRGTLDPAAIPPEGPVYATLAGDPLERGTGTIAWPMRPDRGLVKKRELELVLDGVPGALDREKARAWAARRAGVLVLAAAAVAEVLLLLFRSRASQQRLEAHLADASAPGLEGDAGLSAADRARLLGSAREYPILRALLLAAIIALGFAMMAALATFR